MIDKPEPTAEHIDAVARVLSGWAGPSATARQILTTDDPDAQAALAANLPREVMLAALKARGEEYMRVIDSDRVIPYIDDDDGPRVWVDSP